MAIIRDLFLFDSRFRVGFIILVCLLALVTLSFVSPYEQTARRVAPRNRTPSSQHILGTNALGQDIFWQLTFAIRNSLLIGLIAATVSRFIAILNGMISGYLGGPVDRVLSTITDSFVVIPRLPLLILLSFVFRGGMSTVTIAFLLGVLDWAWPSKRYRSQVLSLREREFTYTAVYCGMNTLKVIWKQHFPFLISYMMADFISGFLWALGTEITLSVLGLSNLGTPTIGTMIYWANYYQAMLQGTWWWLAPPVIASILTILSFYMLSISVSQFLDPRTRIQRLSIGG
ncbi:MAG: ABC transporter permease [Firmicutes bacterium]|nr:ABC transporter permease [Bacillota bacterium]